MKEALHSVKVDREWEKEEVVDVGDLRAGQIGIRVNFSGGTASLDMKGAGSSPNRPTKRQEKDIKPKQKVVIHAKLPAIATKSVFAEDLYKVCMLFQFSFFWLGISQKPILFVISNHSGCTGTQQFWI